MSQGYIGKTCPYCQFPLKADSDVVECPACKVPHHRECWAENGGCTTFGCREKSYQSVVAADRLEVSFDELSGRVPAPALGGGVNKMLAVAFILSLLVIIGLIIGWISGNTGLFNSRTVEIVDPAAPVSPGAAVDPGDVVEEAPQTYGPAVIAGLDADYYIDYENGTIPIGDLPIGARVADPTWEWEYRLGDNYSDRDWYGDPTPPGEVKPVIWLVVAKDHYEGLDPHVTLLSEELIGLFAFDDSTDRGHEYAEYGYNHWGESGTGNARHGLRPWLNSTGIHAGEGFYRAFSESFKQAVLTTTLPNREWRNGGAYSTSDHVFIPSTTELNVDWYYPIGRVYAYFVGAGDEERIALVVGDGWYDLLKKWHVDLDITTVDYFGIVGNSHAYWTRAPDPRRGDRVYQVPQIGSSPIISFAFSGYDGVRPALNLKSEILVSEIKN